MSRLPSIFFTALLVPMLAFGATNEPTVNAAPKTYNDTEIIADLHSIEAKLPMLEKLFADCKAANIRTDYDLVNYTVIKRFIGYGQDDVKNGYLPRAAYMVQELQRLYLESADNLTAFLEKKEKPLPAYLYRTGPMQVRNRSLIARVLEPTGKLKRRPVFLLGYCGWDQVRCDIPVFNDFGVNEAAIEIGPSSVVFPPKDSNELYSIDLKNLENNILPALAKAEENNISVDLLLSPHYFPKWALEKWPDLINYLGNEKYYFMNFSIDAPKARVIEEAFLRAVVPKVKNYRSLHSIILSNEPRYFDSSADAYTKPLWIAYLKNTYGSIENLSETHGKTYASFDEVPVPSGEKHEATPLFYDWTVFNMGRFANWHSWMADIIRSMAPNIPLHTKIVGDYIFQRVEDVGEGIDPERMCKLSDINGCDACAWVTDDQPDISKFMFYDLLASMKTAPVFNSEDHYIQDRDAHYGPEYALHVRTDLFMGAFHGCSASSGWVWMRTYDKKHDAVDSILSRPDVVAAAGKTCLDLNRLAYEVTAFQKAPANVAILYSVASHVYGPYVKEKWSRDQATFLAYEGAIYSGQKTAFISEEQIAQGKLAQYKALIVPDSRNVPGKVLAGIKQYLSNGGKVLFLGDKSLSKDEYNRPAGSDYPTVYAASTIMMSIPASGAPGNMPLPKEFQKKLGEQFDTLGLFSKKLIDVATKEPATGIDYRFVQYSGRTLMVAANYLKRTTEVTLEIDGKRVEQYHDLLADKDVCLTTLKLEPFKPIFVELK